MLPSLLLSPNKAMLASLWEEYEEIKFPSKSYTSIELERAEIAASCLFLSLRIKASSFQPSIFDRA